MLTSALTGQQSTVRGSTVNGPTGQPRREADRWAPRVRPGIGKKEKRPWFGPGLKVVVGWLETQLGLARLVVSARPAARQAGSGSGLAGRILGRLGLIPRKPASLPRGLCSSLRLLLLAARWLLVSSFADRAVPCVGPRGIRCGGVRVRCGRWVCVCACGRRGACASEDARRVLGEKPQRLGRDANATSRPRRGGWARTARPWRGHGEAKLFGQCGVCVRVAR
jgi:hypothetical protein